MTSDTALLTAHGEWLSAELGQLSEYIWQSTLGLPVAVIDRVPDAVAAEPTMDGFINITGDWQGAVVLQMPQSLAARIASIMFALGQRHASTEDMLDALGEITNQTGGNIKALMPGTCHLSLPTVVRGNDYAIRVPGTEVVTRVVLACEASAFIVNIIAARA